MSIVENRRVVVTGKVPNESRQTAEAKLREAGAIVQTAVNKDTDILVIGAAVGAKKMNAARELGVVVVPWEEAFGKTSGSSKAPPAPRAPMPTVKQYAPMLCKAAELPEQHRDAVGDRWLYEIKWDGLRGIATIKDGQVSLQSRSGKSDLTERFPYIVEELSDLKDCVLDGEIAAMNLDGDDTTRFIAFDIISEDGFDVKGLPLEARRTILDATVEDGLYVCVSPAFDDSEALLKIVVAAGLEGVVSKKWDSKYAEGARNDNWLKYKVRLDQEFIVLGYTPGEGARAWAFGALILGYSEDGQIKYAGKVGTGFDDQELGKLKELMLPFEVGASPWDLDLPNDLSGSTWIAPSLVVQVAFQKFTEDGLLWHPSYQGVRDDKEPWEVVRES
jgi:bifunctional non-homologous end joining protein LigD